MVKIELCKNVVDAIELKVTTKITLRIALFHLALVGDEDDVLLDCSGEESVTHFLFGNEFEVCC